MVTWEFPEVMETGFPMLPYVYATEETGSDEVSTLPHAS